MLHFQLFRIKVQEPTQRSFLFSNKPTTSELLVLAIKEKPSAELRKGYTWHIGNIFLLDDEGLYFALGRTANSIVELYDEERGDFTEEESETSPYTHVLLDVKFQFCAIATKLKLAPKPRGIAQQLEKLLNNTKIAREREILFNVSEIKDPEDFISLIRSAYAIYRFSMTFSLPNPFDVEQDFHAPMERLLREATGQKGKTSILGENLNSDVLEKLARSTAASGDDAEAKIKTGENQKPILKKLSGNPVAVEVESVATDEERRGLLSLIRDIYQKLRGDTEQKGDQ